LNHIDYFQFLLNGLIQSKGIIYRSGKRSSKSCEGSDALLGTSGEACYLISRRFAWLAYEPHMLFPETFCPLQMTRFFLPDGHFKMPHILSS
jgi:hypothetical protein